MPRARFQPLIGLTLALVLPVARAAPTPTLAVNYAGAGVTSSIAATCLAGSYPGGDARGCDGSITETPSTEGDVLYGAGHAVFVGQGVDTQAWGQARFGVLGAYAQTVDTNVLQFLNTQARGASSMKDYIVASNGAGAADTVYQYVITVHGSLSPPVGFYGTFPYGLASSSVNFNAQATSFCPGCDDPIKNWSAESGEPSNTVLTGSFSMVTGTTFQMSAGLDVSSYLNVFPGQSATATADYGSTVTVQLLAVTPGANTIGVSGHDYALAAAVPEPPPAALALAGLAVLVSLVRRRRIHN